MPKTRPREFKRKYIPRRPRRPYGSQYIYKFKARKPRPPRFFGADGDYKNVIKNLQWHEVLKFAFESMAERFTKSDTKKEPITEVSVIVTKQCSINVGCGKMLPISMFCPTSRNRSGTYYICKPCLNKRARENRKKLRDKRKAAEIPKVPITEKMCSGINGCGRLLQIREFVKHSKNKTGYGSICKLCDRKRTRIYYMKNNEKVKAYRDKHKEIKKTYGNMYRKINKERICKQRRMYWQENRERLLEEQRLYYKENKEKFWVQQKIYRIKNRERISNNMYKHRYGLTLGDVRRMKEVRNYCCDICKRNESDVTKKTLVVDHRHNYIRGVINTVRGILCSDCNNGLGLHVDSQDLLKNSISYLNRLPIEFPDLSDKWRLLSKSENEKNCYLYRTYGIGFSEYEYLLGIQDYRCAICNVSHETKKLAVDHNHKIEPIRKSIRGLLCGNCNLAIGLFRDDPEVIENAIGYLKKAEDLKYSDRIMFTEIK